MWENYAIIVAGGIGSRMGTDTPKQFLPLAGLPVMMHAINAFHESNTSPHIIAVIHPSLLDRWSELCETHCFGVPHTVATGGRSRFESVRNGLDVVKSMGIELSRSCIAVHDAARPLITPDLIDRTYRQAALSGTAALAIQSTNSVRIKSSNGLKNSAYRRDHVYLMQTPQTFNGAVLDEAYGQPDDKTCTDDASVVEKKGYPIALVDGDTRNIKITFPEDLRIAEILFGTLRSGSASDDAQ